MKKLLLLLLVAATTLTACNDSHDCGPDWLPPYMGPQGSPIPGYPHGDDPDYPGKWKTLAPEQQAEAEQWDAASDEEKAQLREEYRRQCGC